MSTFKKRDNISSVNYNIVIRVISIITVLTILGLMYTGG